MGCLKQSYTLSQGSSTGMGDELGDGCMVGAAVWRTVHSVDEGALLWSKAVEFVGVGGANLKQDAVAGLLA